MLATVQVQLAGARIQPSKTSGFLSGKGISEMEPGGSAVIAEVGRRTKPSVFL